MTYHMVEDSFWTDDKIVRAPNAAKQVMLFLMTGPQANMSGCACVRVMTIADALYGVEMGNDEHMPMAIKRVKDGLAYLKDNGVIIRCDETGWTWMVNHLKHRPIPNPKAGIATMKIIRTVPQNLFFYQELMEAYRIHSHESVSRVSSNNGVLCLKQINALIQSHRKRYGIDTVSGKNDGSNGDPKQYKIEDKKGSESTHENNGLEVDTQSDTVPVPETVLEDTPPVSPPSEGKKKSRSSAADRGSRLGEDWRASEDQIQYALDEGFDRRGAEREAENFRDYWLSAAGAKARKADWNRTFKTWIRRAADRLPAITNGANGHGQRDTLSTAERVLVREQQIDNARNCPPVGWNEPLEGSGCEQGSDFLPLARPSEEVPDCRDQAGDEGIDDQGFRLVAVNS